MSKAQHDEKQATRTAKPNQVSITSGLKHSGHETSRGITRRVTGQATFHTFARRPARGHMPWENLRDFDFFSKTSNMLRLNPINVCASLKKIGVLEHGFLGGQHLIGCETQSAKLKLAYPEQKPANRGGAAQRLLFF